MREGKWKTLLPWFPTDAILIAMEWEKGMETYQAFTSAGWLGNGNFGICFD